MASKFFNKKVKKTYRGPSLKLILIILGAALLITLITWIVVAGAKKSSKDIVVELKDNISVDLHGNPPETESIFKSLKNIKMKDIEVSYDNVDFNTIGSYEFTITIKDKVFTATILVEDNEYPELYVHDLEIKKGETYNIQDFVTSCTDNSEEECIVYYINDDDADITSAGTHEIKLSAKDSSNNSTPVQTVTLTIIGNNNDTCKFGNMDYDKNKYVLSINVTKDNCARDLNLYLNEKFIEPAEKLVNKEETYLKKYLSTVKLDLKNIVFKNEITPVVNLSGKGIVGYEIEITLVDQENPNNPFAKYKIKQNGDRVYTINKYNLK